VTLLETARWQDLPERNPVPREWAQKQRQVNWSFLVIGNLPGDTEKSRLRLADWLSAGGRAWITDSIGGAAAVPRWLGVSALPSGEALKFRAPAIWQGDIIQVLTRYTSEAAARFSLGRRGVIAQGAPADFVLWNIPDQGSPSDLRDCKPRFALINGQVVDLSQTEGPAYGRFLAR
jgi:predicted amidohydrolase YtcJ